MSNHNMNNILETHFNNINILANTIQSSHMIVQRMQEQNTISNTHTRTNNLRTNAIFDLFSDETNTRRPPRRRRRNVGTEYDNNTTRTPSTTPNYTMNATIDNQNDRLDSESNVYYFTFDTLGQSLLNNRTNVYAQDVSFQTLLITEENKDIINGSDGSMNNADNSGINHQLYEVAQYDLIEHPINDICPITRERFDSTTEHILMIKNCKHIFNKSALNTWLEHNSTCPYCRCQI